VVVLCAAVVAVALFVGPFRGGAKPSGSPSGPAALASVEPSSSPMSTPATNTWSPAPATTVVATATPSIGPSPTPSPTTSPNLPSLLAAIGDSYSQGYNTSPQHRYDNPIYSWVVGSAHGDGVYSIRERLLALGARLTVVDAATSGKKMNDAPRQAAEIVAAATNLRAGQRAFVTFELGTNDLCDDPKTSAADFQAQLDAAISILREGLPAGSEVLMLPIPDFDHFREITQADPQASAALARAINSRNCAPFLGSDSPLTLDQARATMAQYDSILLETCNAIQSTDGSAGRLYCRSDQALLSDRDFEIADLSTVDYFHPSLSGQAKMAAAAWSASDWRAIPLPAGG